MRARRRQAAKRAIACAVVAGIDDGQTIILDAGTSGLAVAELLVDRVATVCPLSLRAAGVLVRSPTVRLLMPGGFVRPDEQSFVGSEAVRTLDEHVFDTYVMTVSGLSIAGGLTEWNADDGIVKRSALANCRRCVVACDSSKLGQTAFTRIAALKEVDLVVTDDGLDDHMRARLEESGIELLVVATIDGTGPRPAARSRSGPGPGVDGAAARTAVPAMTGPGRYELGPGSRSGPPRNSARAPRAADRARGAGD